MDFSYTQSDLEKLLSPKSVIGKTGSNITNISSLSDANKNSVSFLWNRKYRKDVAMSNAALLLLPESYDGAPKEDQCFFLTKNPSLALAKLCADIEEKYKKNIPVAIHESAVIDKTAKIGRNVSIGANSVIDANAIIGDNSTIGACSYIGRDVSIGNGTVIHNNVTIMNMCKIGDFVIIYSGCVIGSDGFGYETVNGEHVKLPQIGNVIIENNVHIGAKTTIDRARFGHTVIGEGTKIDNLVQVGHNVKIGKRCLIVSQVGISGSTVLGDYVVLGGQVGVAGHIKIADGVMAGGQSGIASNCKKGEFMLGTPALPFKNMNKIFALRKRLPEIFKRVSNIEEIVNEKLGH